MGYMDFRFFVQDCGTLVGWVLIGGLMLIGIAALVGVFTGLLALAVVALLLGLAWLAMYAITGGPGLATLAALPAWGWLGWVFVSSAVSYFSSAAFVPFWQYSVDWQWFGLSFLLAAGFAVLRLGKRVLYGADEPYYL